jgi:hypothetical protein
VRNLLTYIAVALVVVMSAALVAPMLVDWSAHRGEIEARLAAITGANVTLTGPVDLSLLPTPYLALGEGSLTAPGPSGAKLSFASARLELALIKLVSGQIRFSEFTLEKPVLTITRDADGALLLPPLPSERLHSTGFDRLVLRDGKLKVLGGANRAEAEIGGVEIDASAPSLDGPARASGHFLGPNDAPVAFNLASEKASPDGTPLRVEVDAGPSWPAFLFDGVVQSDASGEMRGLRLDGAATLTGVVPSALAGTIPVTEEPWRFAGRMTASLNQATIRDAEFSFGEEERAARAEGEATLAFGSPARLTVALRAKQINLDALLRLKGEDGASPARAMAVLTHAVSAGLDSQKSHMAIDAKISAAPIILGAQTLPDASASLAATPGDPLHLRFNIGLPGRGRLQGTGDLEGGAAGKFKGDIDFVSGDFALLNRWASLGAPPGAAKALAFSGALASGSAGLSGPIEATATSFSGRNLKVTLDRTALTGSIAFTGAARDDPGRLDVDLVTDSLDVDSLPSFAADPAMLRDLDLSLSLKAGSLHIARVGEAEIDSGTMSLRATKTGPSITLERLNVAGLDGASLDIQGSMSSDSVAGSGRLRADRLHDFAALLSRLAPGDWSRTLVERASLLSPASLAFDAAGSVGAADAPTIDSLKASGSAGDTQFTVAVARGAKDGARDFAVTLDSPNSGALLRQLGVKATPGNGRAHASVNASGAWRDGYDINASSSLAGADASWHGRFLPAAPDDASRWFGSAKIKAANLSPLMVTLGFAPAGGGALGPADIDFDATLRGDRWTVSRLAATIAGVKASGGLTYKPASAVEALEQATSDIAKVEETLGAGTASAPARPPSPPEIEGELAVDRMPLAALLALTLGPPQPVKPGARWSDAKFAPPPLRPPSSAIKLKIGTLDVADGLPAQGFGANLRYDKGRVDLNGATMQIAGGSASGRATLRRDGDAATLTGAFNVDSIAVDRPGFSGRLGGNLDFASTGRSPAALIEGLAGAGAVKFSGAALTHSDPGALDRVVARSQSPDAQLDETNIAYAFGNELAKGSFSIPDGSTPIALSAGVMKIGPIAIIAPRQTATLRGDFDLARITLETKLAVSMPASDLKFWSGPPPNASVDVQNALDAPRRAVDVSALSAGLAAQAIARETDRIANLEADIRERAFFNRRLKGERFMDRRQREIEDWRAEQEKLNGLTQHLHELEEAEKTAAELEAAEKKAAEAAAQKAAADRAAAEKTEAERTGTDGGPAKSEAPDGAPGAPKPPAAPKSDEVGANGPSLLSPPTPPAKPKTRPAQIDPTERGLY